MATSFKSPDKKDVVKDVGYSLTIDQNTNQMIAVSPAVTDYQIVRGVSVPYKGLTNDVLLTNFKSQNILMCRIDNYSHTWQRSINTNNELSDKGVNLNINGGFRLDIGEIISQGGATSRHS